MKTNENHSNVSDWTNVQITSTRNNQQELITRREELSTEQRRKIHNKSNTIKQRQRYYRNELIF